jgi:nucleoside-diphosphate-sugar epimerase
METEKKKTPLTRAWRRRSVFFSHFSLSPFSTSTQASSSSPSSSLPHLLVFGGNGFVGTRVCQAALAAGLGVVSVSRSGRPRWAKGEEELEEEGEASSSPTSDPDAWIRDVEWVSADVFDTDAWKSALEGACVGVVSTLGAFGSNSFMERICGDANVAVFEAAKAAGVPRAAFISVHDYGLPSFVLPGYFGGKKKAERALFKLFPESGVALRPGFVYGTRKVVPSSASSSSSNAPAYSIPLGALGAPLDAALSLLPTKTISESVPLAGLAFVPPVKVEGLARAAVAAATDLEVEAGVMSAWEIKERYGG